MLPDDRIDLIGRIARLQNVPNHLGNVVQERSVLALAAASYGAKPDPNSTSPTGFDPRAIILFESIVEGAYLVAAADGEFDDAERETFARIVGAACGGAVPPRRVAKLVLDLSDMLHEDGLDVRVRAIALNVKKREHAQEVMRIGALIADASNGVGHAERQVLEKMAAAFEMSSRDVDQSIEDVRSAMAQATG